MTLVHNPTAGDERPTADDLEKILAEAGFQVRYQSSKKNWKKALQEPADLVVAAGGDGTVAKVLSALSGTNQTVAILPAGTANNIARTLGIHGDAREIVSTWLKAKPKPFDIGVVSTAGREHRFVEGAGGGLFAAAIVQGREEVENGGTILGNEIDRALVHLRRILEKARPRRWRVDVDGSDLSGDYLAVEAMNIRYAGPGIPIAPEARPGDGLLDVVMIGERDRPALDRYLDERLKQHAVKLPNVTVLKGRHIVIAGSRVPMRIDDELVKPDGAEWQIVVKRGAVRLLR